MLYTTLMTVCHKGGQPERAMRIFRAMEGEGLQADVVRPSCMPGRHAMQSAPHDCTHRRRQQPCLGDMRRTSRLMTAMTSHA